MKTPEDSSKEFYEKVKALDKPEALIAVALAAQGFAPLTDMLVSTIGFALTAEMFERMAVECRKDVGNEGEYSLTKSPKETH